MNNKVSQMINESIICALYVALTVVNPFSYDAIQFRISEILLFLCFYRKDYSIGLILGCFIANLFGNSEIKQLDIIFGTLATALTCLCIMFSKHKGFVIIFPTIFNGIIIGIELTIVYNTPFLFNCLTVALGELTVMIIGLLIFIKLEKNDFFYKIINANQNIKKTVE